MTTLPQTTAIRVPRPTNGQMLPSPISVPSSMGPAMVSGVQMTPADVWRVIRGNLWLILLITVLAAGAGVGLYFYLLKFHPVYTAKGYIQIRPKVEVFDPLKPQTVTMTEQMLSIQQRTQVQLLMNDALFSQLLQKPDIQTRQTGWFKQFIGKNGQPNIPKAKEELADELRVRPIPESELVEVSMSYQDPKDTRIIVEDIVNEHLDDQRRDSNVKQMTRSTTLNALRRKYEFTLTGKAQEAREKAVRLSVDGATGQPGRVSAKEMELAELVEQKFEIQKDINKAKGELETLNQQIQNGIDPSAASEMVDRDSTLR